MSTHGQPRRHTRSQKGWSTSVGPARSRLRIRTSRFRGPNPPIGGRAHSRQRRSCLQEAWKSLNCSANDASVRRESSMIFRSPYPDITIPDVPITDYALRQTARLATKAALIDSVTGTVPVLRGTCTARSNVSPVDSQNSESGRAMSSLSTRPTVSSMSSRFTRLPPSERSYPRSNYTYLSKEVAEQLRMHHASYLLTTDELLDRVEEATSITSMCCIMVIGEPGPHTSFNSLLDSARPAPRTSIDPCATMSR